MENQDAISSHIPHLRRYARALRRDATAADDLVQDCLERAVSKFHLFREGTNLRAWLFTILHNLHVNAVRRQSRQPDNVTLDESNTRKAAAANRPDDRLIIRDLGRALEKLAEEQRDVLLLVGLEEMTYKEAAEILDVPIGTVMSRLARGRERLWRLMEGDDAPALRRVK